MWLFLALLLLLPSAGSAHDRVISLSPQITESIFLLGGEERLIGVTTFCTRPAKANLKEKVGTPLRPDVEKIVSLAPDLVLASREGNPPLLAERLRNLGLKVHYFKRPATFAEMRDNFLHLSRLLGRAQQGREIIAAAEKDLPWRPAAARPRVFWQVGADPLIAASTASFANEIIALAGGTNIIQMDIPYPRLNVEEVVVRKPQVIVLTQMGYHVDREMARWNRYLPGTITIVFDANVVGSPTPVTFLEAVKKLSRGMGGE